MGRKVNFGLIPPFEYNLTSNFEKSSVLPDTEEVSVKLNLQIIYAEAL